MGILRIGAWAMGTLAVICVGALALGFLLPSTWEAEASTEVAAPPAALAPYLMAGSGWLAWTPGPESGVEPFGPETGEGSGYEWDDPAYGQGTFRITSVEPDREVRYRVEVEGGSIVIEGVVTLEAVPDAVVPGTRIHWRESGDFGWNPLLSYLSGRMAELQGEQLTQSLRTLRGIVEGDREGSGGVPADAEPPSNAADPGNAAGPAHATDPGYAADPAHADEPEDAPDSATPALLTPAGSPG